MKDSCALSFVDLRLMDLFPYWPELVNFWTNNNNMNYKSIFGISTNEIKVSLDNM